MSATGEALGYPFHMEKNGAFFKCAKIMKGKHQDILLNKVKVSDKGDAIKLHTNGNYCKVKDLTMIFTYNILFL